MNFTYHLHPQVEQELAEGYSWYESKQVGLGKRLLAEVRSKIEEIVNYPDLLADVEVTNIGKPDLIIFRIS